MKNKLIYFFKTTQLPVFICLLGLALFLVSCEKESNEVHPQAIDKEVLSTDARTDMKNLPHQELARLRAAVARYHNFKNALADGYTIDASGYVSHMGHHYLKASLVDGTFELERPEFLIYIPGPNGRWRFVGVEYAVSILDITNPQPAPEGFSGDADVWVINNAFKIWTLHAWVGLNNPDGIFASHNPRIP